MAAAWADIGLPLGEESPGFGELADGSVGEDWDAKVSGMDIRGNGG